MAELESYESKRDFEKTPEPRGEVRERSSGRAFVVQKHAARRLHYDFRLEVGGVLVSWAVPKGPSLDPEVRRLAVQTEDHPLGYGDFEGVIPKGEYGGGTVLVWDRGAFEPEGDPAKALKRGRLTFSLDGEKLKGRFHLVRTGREGDKSWLLFKGKDDEARPGAPEVTEQATRSVITGRDLDEVAGDHDRVWRSSRKARGPDPAELEGAKKGLLPAVPAPCLPTLVSEAPAGDEWLHEMKLDGYRLLARVQKGKVRLLTRRGQDWTERFPTVARALTDLGLQEATLDGEVVVLDEHGRSDFQALQQSLTGDGKEHVYFAFDLLGLGEYDLREVPLVERKAALRQLLDESDADPGRLRFSDHVIGQGPAFLETAAAAGLEGIVSKRARSHYEGRRSRRWLKVKHTLRQEVVVGGYTLPQGQRRHLGALLVGEHDAAGNLIYAGKVGTGYSEATLDMLAERLDPLVVDDSPFAPGPSVPAGRSAARSVRWVKPALVAEVAYAGRTQEGLLRHPAFVGLREDKGPEQVRSEAPPVSAALPETFRLTSPDKLLYPDLGVTKRELAAYYARVAERMLPHLVGRPLTLLRCPHGTPDDEGKGCFFQKHANERLPDGIVPTPIDDELHLTVTGLEGLLGLVQMGCLEIHTWGSRVDALEHPDQLAIDLDPDPTLPWPEVISAARLVRDRLADLGLQSFCKLTGGKGLHVVAPLARENDWEEVRAFTQGLAQQLEEESPRRFTANMAKTKRGNKIYVDYVRNTRGASVIAPYSTRAKAGAPVALPVAWDDLAPTVRAPSHDLRQVAEGLTGPDPWAGFFDVDQALPNAKSPA